MRRAFVGRPMLRVEDPRLLLGHGSYTDDWPSPAPGLAFAAFVRSPHAHALVVGIDTRTAAAASGVVAVLTGMVHYPDLNKDAGVSDAFKRVGLGWPNS